MTLDTSVMNVAIATVAEDVGTDVTGIQTAITLYTLVMATLMITGGKVGALIGRKRAFAIGCVIYGTGSFITSIAPSLPVLLIGWSFLEGVGAALILPAIVALVAANFGAEGRPRAYGLVMAAGAIAVAAITELFEESSRRVPLIISGTVTDLSGRTLSGQTVEAFLTSIAHANPLMVGLNCALGPNEMKPYIEELAHGAPLYTSAYPNAGLPDPLSATGFPETPESLAPQLREWARKRLAQHGGRVLRHNAGPHPR